MPDRFLLKGQERRQCLLEKEHGSHFTTEMLSLWLLEWQVTESLLRTNDSVSLWSVFFFFFKLNTHSNRVEWWLPEAEGWGDKGRY